MNIQLLLVIICVGAAALFIGLRFWRALRSRHCPGCSKANCCDPTACQQPNKIEELRPRQDKPKP